MRRLRAWVAHSFPPAKIKNYSANMRLNTICLRFCRVLGGTPEQQKMRSTKQKQKKTLLRMRFELMLLSKVVI